MELGPSHPRNPEIRQYLKNMLAGGRGAHEAPQLAGSYCQLRAAGPGESIFFRGVALGGLPCPSGWHHTHVLKNSTKLTQ